MGLHLQTPAFPLSNDNPAAGTAGADYTARGAANPSLFAAPHAPKNLAQGRNKPVLLGLRFVRFVPRHRSAIYLIGRRLGSKIGRGYSSDPGLYFALHCPRESGTLRRRTTGHGK